MSLVDYSSSEEEESYPDENSGSPLKKRCRLSNGTSLSPPKISQDDKNIGAEAAGRVRTFAHERGNWATFIYIPIPFSDSIRELQAQIVKSFENDSSMQLNCIESLHISLTRTVVLQHHWIDDFTKSVRESLTDFRKFTLNLNTVNVYCNDDCTTTFVAIAVPEIYCAPLKSLVEKFNNCLGEYKLPFFYKDASFHVSLLWCLGNKKSQILMEVEKLEQLLHEAIEDDYEDYQIAVNRIECKVGNKIHNYSLPSW